VAEHIDSRVPAPFAHIGAVGVLDPLADRHHDGAVLTQPGLYILDKFVVVEGDFG
jgi:hypothetical protein